MIHVIKPDRDESACYAFAPESVFKKGDVLTLGNCYRCFGGFIFLERNMTNPLISHTVPRKAVIAFHIVPGKVKFLKLVTRELFEYLSRYVSISNNDFTVTRIVRCGGLIDSIQNEYLFKIMEGKINQCLLKKFPGVTIEIIPPEKTTTHMKLTVSGNLTLEIEHCK